MVVISELIYGSYPWAYCCCRWSYKVPKIVYKVLINIGTLHNYDKIWFFKSGFRFMLLIRKLIVSTSIFGVILLYVA